MHPTEDEPLNRSTTVMKMLQRLTEAGFSLAELADGLDGPGSTPAESPLELLKTALNDGQVSAKHWVDAASRHLDRAPTVVARGGSYATPAWLAEWLADRMRVRAPVLDPACGCGQLLLAAARHLNEPKPLDFMGWDIRPDAVFAARIALWMTTGRRYRVSDFEGLKVADALFATPLIEAGSVIANPPFVSIRRLTREWGADYTSRLRLKFAALSGNFDLFVPFLFSLRRWLRADGRFGLILPATFWSADYAASARSRLFEDVAEVHRILGRDVFDSATVTTHVLIGAASTIGPIDFFKGETQEASVTIHSEGQLTREALPASGFPDLNGAATLRDTVPLGDLCRVSAGTPGYQARVVADALFEDLDQTDNHEPRSGRPNRDPQTTRRFVVTRNIDRYHLNEKAVRYMGRTLVRPRLPLEAVSAGKANLFSASKILVAGVARQMEAVRDHCGVALGVGVYAVTNSSIPDEVIVALLNSSYVSNWYRRRFLGRELSGGYFAVNCGHLRLIPVPVSLIEAGPNRRQLVDLVREREAASHTGLSAERTALDRRLDALIEKSYSQSTP